MGEDGTPHCGNGMDREQEAQWGWTHGLPTPNPASHAPRCRRHRQAGPYPPTLKPWSTEPHFKDGNECFCSAHPWPKSNLVPFTSPSFQVFSFLHFPAVSLGRNYFSLIILILASSILKNNFIRGLITEHSSKLCMHLSPS